MFFKSKKRADDPQWQSEILERLALTAWKEQRSARRWGIFFKLLFFAYVTFILIAYTPTFSGGIPTQPEHTAVVELKGMISDNTPANANKIIQGLQDAFANPKAKAVILSINSPGGSAVQSDEIYGAIRSLRNKYPDKKIYSAISDIGASGAYYVASATDEIYANPSSLVGSIGVLFNGFGFTSAIDKLGVERRVFTAGEHKDTLDPFRPVTSFDKTYIKNLLDDIHETFIDRVKAGRGARLAKGREDELFSGMAWTGRQAKSLGLVDAFGDIRHIADAVVKAPTLVDYTQSENLFDRLGVKAANFISEQVQTVLPWKTSNASGVEMIYQP